MGRASQGCPGPEGLQGGSLLPQHFPFCTRENGLRELVSCLRPLVGEAWQLWNSKPAVLVLKWFLKPGGHSVEDHLGRKLTWMEGRREAPNEEATG